MDKSLGQVLVAIVSPLLTWCLALTTAWIAQRGGDKDTKRLYERNIKLIQDNVHFIQSWWQAYNEVCDSPPSSTVEIKREATEKLEQTLQSFTIQQYLYAIQPSVTRQNYLLRFVRWVLLTQPKTGMGNTLRTIYYVVGSLLLTAGSVYLPVIISSKAYVTNSTPRVVLVLLGPCIALILILLPMRWMVGAVDDWLISRKSALSVNSRSAATFWRHSIWNLEMRMSDPTTYWSANHEFREVALMVGTLISNNYIPTMPEYEARLRVQSAEAANPPSSLHGNLIRAAIDLLWDTSTLSRYGPTPPWPSAPYGAWVRFGPPEPAAAIGEPSPVPRSAPAGRLAATGKRGVATASLVLGILAVLLGFFVVGIGTGIVGLILGIIAHKRRRSGVSLAGIILSAVGIALGIVWVVAVASLPS